MACLTRLTSAIYVDGELPPEEARTVEHHLTGCARCRALVAALRDENRVLTAALGELETVRGRAPPPCGRRWSPAQRPRRRTGAGLGRGDPA